METRQLFHFLAFLSFGPAVLAVFINPPPTESQIDNPIYELGQEVKIRWNTNAEFTDLTMWQTDTGKRYNLQSNSKSQEYTWIASYQGIDPADGNSFSFWLFETGQTGSLFSSHTFNITDPTSHTISASQSTETKEPQTKTNAKTTSEATETTGKPTSSSSLIDDTPSSSGLSSGAIAGVAVGSVAGSLLIAGAAFMLWRRKKTKDVAGHTAEIEAAKYAPVEAPNDNGAHHGPWEMGDSRTQAHELPATDYTHNHRPMGGT